MPILLFGSSPSNVLPPLGIDATFTETLSGATQLAVDRESSLVYARNLFRATGLSPHRVWTPETGWVQAPSGAAHLRAVEIENGEIYTCHNADNYVRVLDRAGIEKRRIFITAAANFVYPEESGTTITAATSASVDSYVRRGTASLYRLPMLPSGSTYTYSYQSPDRGARWGHLYALYCGGRYSGSDVAATLELRSALAPTTVIRSVTTTISTTTTAIGVGKTGTVLVGRGVVFGALGRMAYGVPGLAAVSFPNVTVTAFAYLESNGCWYAATTGGIYKSADDGLSFQYHSAHVLSSLVASRDYLIGSTASDAAFTWSVMQIQP